MRHYETIYIVNPNLGEEDYREIIEKFNRLIEDRKGLVVKTNEWGKQRMAYEVKKFYNGFYILVDFCADPGVTAELERSLKLDDRILKYQTVKLADKVDPHELIRKEKEANKESAPQEDQDIEKEPAVKGEETVKESEVENGKP
ncbi:30S ribosomal protein S6 [Thermodesulfobacteriota bacterium]